MPKHLSARKPMDYNPKDDDRRSGVPPGDYTLNTSVTRLNLVLPPWEAGSLQCRSWGYPKNDDPTKFFPGRLSSEQGHFSPWRVRLPGAAYIGLPDCGKFTFNLYPYKTSEEKVSQNPYLIFYNACKAAFEAGNFGKGRVWKGYWNKYIEGLKGAKKSGAPIGAPTTFSYMMGHVYTNGENVYVGDKRNKPMGLEAKDPLQIIRLKGSAVFNLDNLCNLELDSYEGDPEADPSVMYAVGDPVGKHLAKKGIVKGGVIWQIFNPKKLKIKGPNSSWNGEIKVNQGYEVAFHKEIELDGVIHKASMSSEDIAVALDKIKWWDDSEDEKGLLKFLSYEEQAVLIARAFASEPKLVTFAFSDEDAGADYLKLDAVKGILSSRVTSVVPKDDEEEEEDEDEEDEDTPKKAKKHKTDPTVKKNKKMEEDEDEEDEDEEDEEDIDDDAEDEDEDSDDEEETDEDEDDEEPVKKGKKVSSKKGTNHAVEKASSKHTAEEEDAEEEEDEDAEDEEDEDEVPVKKVKKKVVQQELPFNGKKKSKKEVDEFEDEDSEEEDEDEDSEEEVDEEDEPTSKSLKAAKEAKARSVKRTSPKKEPPIVNKKIARKG